jgi:hypothetical protein
MQAIPKTAASFAYRFCSRPHREEIFYPLHRVATAIVVIKKKDAFIIQALESIANLDKVNILSSFTSWHVPVPSIPTKTKSQRDQYGTISTLRGYQYSTGQMRYLLVLD